MRNKILVFFSLGLAPLLVVYGNNCGNIGLEHPESAPISQGHGPIGDQLPGGLQAHENFEKFEIPRGKVIDNNLTEDQLEDVFDQPFKKKPGDNAAIESENVKGFGWVKVEAGQTLTFEAEIKPDDQGRQPYKIEFEWYEIVSNDLCQGALKVIIERLDGNYREESEGFPSCSSISMTSKKWLDRFAYPEITAPGKLRITLIGGDHQTVNGMPADEFRFVWASFYD